MPDAIQPERESTKQHSLRIRLDYHKAPDPARRNRYILVAISLLASLAYLAWMLVGGEQAATQFSHGPVANVHAAWDGKCAACHTDFVSLRPDAQGVKWLATFTGLADAPPADDPHHLTDAKCIACHAGPPHHSNQLQHEVESCAACHRDHQGRGADIARPDDRVCTACHQDIGSHRLAGKSLYPEAIRDVSRFAMQGSSANVPHPPFRSLPETDENDFKFNHALHMLPGQFPADATAGARWTLGKIPEEQRERYRTSADQSLDAAVQLDCASCHALDLQGSQAGAYMLPVDYERHCKACHPLDVPGSPGLTVRHGLKQSEIKDQLYGHLAADREKDAGPAKTLSPNQPIPGKSPGNNLAQSLPLELQQQADEWQQGLYNQRCLYCHTDAPPPQNQQQWTPPADIATPRIPQIWLEHARFDHSAHRSMNCKECHADAFPDSASGRPPLDDSKVMIPDMTNCVQCHAPGNATLGAGGGARSDCIECHRYHGSETKRSTVGQASTLTNKLTGQAGSGIAMLREAFMPKGSTAGQASSGTNKLTGQAGSGTALRITPTDFRKAALQTSVSHAFLGSGSCAASGCHGKAASASVSWENAYTVWLQNDPHRQAFDVLYTDRSVRMYRLLAHDPSEVIDEAGYLQFLEQRCIGCHATPTIGSTADAGQSTPAQYAHGVSCESCHGPSGEWLHKHYLESWPVVHTPARDDLVHVGFSDTRTLASRAGVCVDCHVGPQRLGGMAYDVDHDLIAAGHPRLMFEFRSYLSNLPPHWNVAADRARQQPGIQGESNFHFEAWRAGQVQTARQQLELLESHAANGPELSNYDCYDCHHPLGSQPWRQARTANGSPRGLARPALVSMDQCSVLAGKAEYAEALMKLKQELAGWSSAVDPSMRFQNLARQLVSLAAPASASVTIAQRARVILALIERLRGPNGSPPQPTWDEAVQLYLAASALAADLPPQTMEKELGALQAALQSSLSGPTQYDSPVGFKPELPQLQASLLSLERAVGRLVETDR